MQKSPLSHEASWHLLRHSIRECGFNGKQSLWANTLNFEAINHFLPSPPSSRPAPLASGAEAWGPLAPQSSERGPAPGSTAGLQPAAARSQAAGTRAPPAFRVLRGAAAVGPSYFRKAGAARRAQEPPAPPSAWAAPKTVAADGPTV
jgi:hypothetical protein